MHGFRTTRFATLATLGISMARRAATDVTIDNYSLVPTVNGSPPVITPAINGVIDSVAGVSSLGVQADGETQYAETVVVTQDAVIRGTSTLTGFSLAPSTTVYTFAEDASRFSASQLTVFTDAGVTVSSGFQEVCSGAVGAQATCVINQEYSVETTVSFTETFAAVRTPAFTITSTSGSARAAAPAALATIMAFAVAVMLYTAVL